MFLPHFDVFCDLLLNRRSATWNLFVKLMTLLVSMLYADRNLKSLETTVDVELSNVYDWLTASKSNFYLPT